MVLLDIIRYIDGYDLFSQPLRVQEIPTTGELVDLVRCPECGTTNKVSSHWRARIDRRTIPDWQALVLIPCIAILMLAATLGLWVLIGWITRAFR